MKQRAITMMAMIMLSCALLQISANATESTTLRMLIWEGYAPEHLRMKFKELMKTQGIDVTFEIKYVSGPDEFTSALKKWKADMITPSNHQPKDGRYKLIKNRLTLPLDLSKIQNYRDIIPALQKAEYCTVKGKVYSIPLARGPYGLIYNSDVVKDEPRSLNVLLDPKYKGRYAMAGDFDDSNIYVAALAAGIDRKDIFSFAKVYTPAVREKLKAITQNAESFWLGIDEAKCHKGLALGLTWGFCLPELRQMGENWKLASPKEGTTGWVDGFMIASAVQRDPVKLNVCHEYLNFVLSTDYQLYVVRGLASAPVTESIKNHLNPDEIADFHLDDPRYFAETFILWQPLKKKDRDGFRAMWKEATTGFLERKIAIGKDRIK